MNELNILVNRFLRSSFRFKKLKENESTPDYILEKEQEIQDSIISTLKEKCHFDIVEFINSPNGQELLHKDFIQRDAYEKASERCNICNVYTIKQGCKKKVMKEDDPYPLICKEFVPSRFKDRLERIFDLLNRCLDCVHHAQKNQLEIKCRENMDMDEIECLKFKKDSNVNP